jgi:hypothetical protein
MRVFSQSAKTGAVATVLVATLAVIACAGKLTKANYDKVANGMTPKDVEVILGPGTEQASSGITIPGQPGTATGTATGIGAPGTTVSTKVLVWQSGGKMITVTFLNDQVVAKTQVGL